MIKTYTIQEQVYLWKDVEIEVTDDMSEEDIHQKVRDVAYEECIDLNGWHANCEDVEIWESDL